MSIKTWWNRVFSSPEPLTIYTVDTRSSRSRRDDHPFEQHKVNSLLGRGVAMTGDITSETGMVLDGHLRGRITLTGDGTALIVRAGGIVEGPVSSPIVVIRGTVVGDVQGHFVRLYPGARVDGAVAARRLIVDDGAEINSVRMGSGAWVAPALEHLPAVDPAAPAHRQVAAPEGIIDVEPVQANAGAVSPTGVSPTGVSRTGGFPDGGAMNLAPATHPSTWNGDPEHHWIEPVASPRAGRNARQAGSRPEVPRTEVPGQGGGVKDGDPAHADGTTIPLPGPRQHKGSRRTQKPQSSPAPVREAPPNGVSARWEWNSGSPTGGDHGYPDDVLSMLDACLKRPDRVPRPEGPGSEGPPFGASPGNLSGVVNGHL